MHAHNEKQQNKVTPVLNYVRKWDMFVLSECRVLSRYILDLERGLLATKESLSECRVSL